MFMEKIFVKNKNMNDGRYVLYNTLSIKHYFIFFSTSAASFSVAWLMASFAAMT